MTDLARQPEVRLALDNDALFRVAENLIHLRKHRGLTQQALAERMGTSQAKVARIEGGRENITLKTLERIVGALEGRLGLSITPAEFLLPRLANWWISADTRRDGSHSRLRLVGRVDSGRAARARRRRGR